MTKLIFLILAFISIGGGFYWTQIRPAKIKHDCSWVKNHSNEIPGKKGITIEQIKAQGMLRNCELTPTPIRRDNTLQGLLQEAECSFHNDEIIKKYGSREFVPAKDWWVPATKEEYAFCLHDHGL